jgi:hypothetical protein
MAQKTASQKEAVFCACVNSYFGHFRWVNSFNLRKNITEGVVKDNRFVTNEIFSKISKKKL